MRPFRVWVEMGHGRRGGENNGVRAESVRKLHAHMAQPAETHHADFHLQRAVGIALKEWKGVGAHAVASCAKPGRTSGVNRYCGLP